MHQKKERIKGGLNAALRPFHQDITLWIKKQKKRVFGSACSWPCAWQMTGRFSEWRPRVFASLDGSGGGGCGGRRGAAGFAHFVHFAAQRLDQIGDEA